MLLVVSPGSAGAIPAAADPSLVMTSIVMTPGRANILTGAVDPSLGSFIVFIDSPLIEAASVSGELVRVSAFTSQLAFAKATSVIGVVDIESEQIGASGITAILEAK